MAGKNLNARSRGVGLKGANTTSATPGARVGNVAGRKTPAAGAGTGKIKSGVIPVGKTGASTAAGFGGNPSGVGARKVSGAKTAGGAKPSVGAQNAAYKGIGLR